MAGYGDKAKPKESTNPRKVAAKEMGSYLIRKKSYKKINKDKAKT